MISLKPQSAQRFQEFTEVFFIKAPCTHSCSVCSVVKKEGGPHA